MFVTAAAEHGEDGVAGGALEGAAGQAAIGLLVADLGLDHCPASECMHPLRGALRRRSSFFGTGV